MILQPKTWNYDILLSFESFPYILRHFSEGFQVFVWQVGNFCGQSSTHVWRNPVENSAPVINADDQVLMQFPFSHRRSHDCPAKTE